CSRRILTEKENVCVAYFPMISPIGKFAGSVLAKSLFFFVILGESQGSLQETSSYVGIMW
ncbi:MAG: hypothetical protein ACR5LD_01430, partial [Symbiopectobacterium sp.]